MKNLAHSVAAVSDQLSCSGQSHQTYWSHGHKVHRRSISASSGCNELGGKSKKKPSVLTNFYFLVNFIRQTGPIVSGPVVKMGWGENQTQTKVGVELLYIW